MGSIYLPYQKPPRWNISRAEVAYNCARLGLPMPVLTMPMWERAGDKAHDYSGEQNNGVFAGSTLPSWASGNLQLPENAYINCGNNDSVRITGKEITMAACFYSTTQVTGDNRVISKRTSAAGSDVYSIQLTSNTIRMRLNGLSRIWDTGSSVYEKEWKICGVADGTNWLIYSDGIEKASDAFSSNLNDSTSPLCLGSRYLEDRWLKGWIKYFYLWDVALTPSQVKVATDNPYGIVEPSRSPAMWSAPVVGVAPTSIFYGPLVGPLGGPI